MRIRYLLVSYLIQLESALTLHPTIPSGHQRKHFALRVSSLRCRVFSTRKRPNCVSLNRKGATPSSARSKSQTQITTPITVQIRVPAPNDPHTQMEVLLQDRCWTILEVKVVSVRSIILAFFDAENRRDWDAYAKFLAADVEWVSYEPPKRKLIQGREAYLTEMKDAYAGRESTFEIENLLVDEDHGLVMAELSIEGRQSVDVFELENGLIHREREYFDDTYWLRHLTTDS